MESGKLTGTLTAGDKTAPVSYGVTGQLYEDGEVALQFEAPKAASYTDDFDGRLKDGVLSFAAKVDQSSKGCAYRFKLARRPL